MCAGVCWHGCLCTTCYWCPWRPEEDIRSPETIVSRQPYGCWESNPGSLEEFAVLLTTEPSLPLYDYFYFFEAWSYVAWCGLQFTILLSSLECWDYVKPFTWLKFSLFFVINFCHTDDGTGFWVLFIFCMSSFFRDSLKFYGEYGKCSYTLVAGCSDTCL